jgi:hypothetical protein
MVTDEHQRGNVGPTPQEEPQLPEVDHQHGIPVGKPFVVHR